MTGARRGCCLRTAALVIGAALVAIPAAHAVGNLRIHGGHLSVVLPAGAWDGRYEFRPLTQGTPAITFANVSLGRWQYAYGQTDPTIFWRASGLMFTVIDQTAAGPSLSATRIVPPLRVRPRDASRFEGIPPNHAFVHRIVRINGRVIELWIQFGHPRLTPTDVRHANERLRAVTIS